MSDTGNTEKKQASTEKKRGLKLSKNAVRYLIVGVVVVALMAASFGSGMAYRNWQLKRAFEQAFSDFPDEPQVAPQEEPTTAPPESIDAPAPFGTKADYKLGEAGDLGSVKVVVNDVDCSSRTWKASGDYSTQITSENGTFCVVSTTITNVGNTPYIVSPGASMEDSEGNWYSTAPDAYDWDVVYSELNPKASIDYEFVFDVDTATDPSYISIAQEEYSGVPYVFSLK